MMQARSRTSPRPSATRPSSGSTRSRRALESDIYVKCEYLNPGGSHEGPRRARTSSRDAERRGLLKPGGTIVEATSGNTGAGAGAGRGARAATSASSSCPTRCRRRRSPTLRAFGAQVVICPTAVEPEDPRSYYQVAKRIADETPNCVLREPVPQPRQPRGALPLDGARRSGSRPGGELDVFVAGMGTGGTISGLRQVLQGEEAGHPARRRRSGRLALLRLRQDRAASPSRSRYKVEGIGEDFFPTTMNLKIIDEIVRVDDKECFLMTRELVRQEGLFVGGSGGAAVAGAIKYAEASEAQGEHPRPPARRRAEVPVEDLQRRVDARERLPRGGAGPRHRRATSSPRKPAAQDRHRRRRAPRCATSSTRMKELRHQPAAGASRRASCAASCSEVDLLRHLVAGQRGRSTAPIARPRRERLRDGHARDEDRALKGVLNDAKIAIVLDRDSVVGIVTKIDLIDYLAEKATPVAT